MGEKIRIIIHLFLSSPDWSGLTGLALEEYVGWITSLDDFRSRGLDGKTRMTGFRLRVTGKKNSFDRLSFARR